MISKKVSVFLITELVIENKIEHQKRMIQMNFDDPKRKIFRLRITDDLKIGIVVDELSEEMIFIPSISFNINEIIFFHQSHQSDNQIDFINDWIDHPTLFNEYNITYQGKEYSLIAEVLFALIINEIKKEAEKKYILTNTFITVPIHLSENTHFMNRMRVSLESIGMKGIESEEVEYEYSKQGEMMQEILEKKEKYEKWKRQLERASISYDTNKEIFTERTPYEFNLQYSCRERTEKQLTTLDTYCCFIASRYLKHWTITSISVNRQRG